MRTFALILIIALLSSGIALKHYIDKSNDQATKIEQQDNNLTNAGEENKTLTVTVKEWMQLTGNYKNQVDSVMKANNIRIRQAKSITIADVQYRDTGSVKIVYKDAIKQPDKSFVIPVSFDSLCWGFKGQIKSLDPKSTLVITERTTSNETNVIVTKQKRFLRFLWIIAPEKIRVFNNCGEAVVTDINFTK